MAHGQAVATPAGVEGWRLWAGTFCAFLLALVFLVAGIWKLSDPVATEARMVQALIPKQLALAVALCAGIFETWAGVMLVVPRWRRWGAWLSALMLVAFMIYMGAFYGRLHGEECNCFPWIQRVVGPAFFVADAAMLVLAGLAAWWSASSQSWRQAMMALGAVAVSAGVLYGVAATRQHGIAAPQHIVVDGKPLSLANGRTLIYFFDPECMHCFAAARQFGAQHWKNVRIVAVPTVNPKWSAGFLRDSGLSAGVCVDQQMLRDHFKFSTDPPYAVAIENGFQLEAFAFFDEKEPLGRLKQLGWIE